MMRDLELGKFRRARVWVGSLPDAQYPAHRTITHVIPASGEPLSPRTAAIELLVPLGPRSMYGLLGGVLMPESNNRMSVEIGVSSSEERMFGNSLAVNQDTVLVGLPEEYSAAVVEGIVLASANLRAVPPGTLTIKCGAYGAVGSCSEIYRRLGSILFDVLSRDDCHRPSEAELLGLFMTRM